MTNSTETTNELVLIRCQDATRQYIGRGKQYSSQDIAAAIDVDDRTVDSWTGGRAVPGLYLWLKLAAVLGPSFVNQFLRLIGMDGADRLDAKHITDADMNAEAAKLVAAMSDALRDLRVDHTEKPSVVKIARKMHSMLTDWLHEHDKPQLREVPK